MTWKLGDPIDMTKVPGSGVPGAPPPRGEDVPCVDGKKWIPLDYCPEGRDGCEVLHHEEVDCDDDAPAVCEGCSNEIEPSDEGENETGTGSLCETCQQLQGTDED